MATAVEQQEGGSTDVPPNSVEIQDLARFAVDDYNKKEKANLKLVEVIRAEKQVVEGFKYNITLEAEDGDGKKNEYETTVWVRSWLDSKEVLQFKRKPLIGGITDVPGASNNIDIEKLARFAVQEHNKKQNAVLEFVKVISAKQQLVAGTIYYITLEAKDGEFEKEYVAKVWVKEWLKFEELLEFKQVTTPGGIVDVPPNSLEIQELAHFAVDQHNQKHHVNLEFVKVIRAQKQVVAGFKYYITLEAKDNERKNVYETQVLVGPGPNSKELLEFNLVPIN